MRDPSRRDPFAVLVKVVDGCNLDCVGCFTEKGRGIQVRHRMALETLELLVEQYKEASPRRRYIFQGGEPTIAGLPFFRRAVELDPGAEFALQTNGILLTDAWAAFLKEHRWLVGVSLNGDAWHNRTRGSSEQYAQVRRAIELLREHDCAYNVLCLVGPHNLREPRQVFETLSEAAQHVQFIPQQGVGKIPGVDPGAWEGFLRAVWQENLQNRGVWVANFASAAGARAFPGLGGDCELKRECGYPTITTRGDVYPCDFFVGNRRWCSGNLEDTSLLKMVRGWEGGASMVLRLASTKGQVGDECQSCQLRPSCSGGCPHWRWLESGDHRGQSPLCGSHKLLFDLLAAHGPTRHAIDRM